MEERALGSLRVSVIGLGCNNFGMMIDADATKAVVDAAVDSGITYFDTAALYGDGKSEEYLGRALATRRGDVVIASKWGHDPESRAGRPEAVRAALEDTLRRLGSDYVDHYQLHRPDPATPPEETLGCLAELRAEGKVREIGCSNFSAAQLDEAAEQAHARDVPPYASVQNRYSVLTRDPETNGVFDACRRLGIAFVPYFPLESGLLTGKYRQGEELPEDARLTKWGERASSFIDDAKLAVVERLTAWAADHGRTLLELALGWQTSNPLTATVIAGGTKPEQVRANAAAGAWRLTPEERDEVAGLTR